MDLAPLEIDLVRQNPGVDPRLHVWGWEVPVYLFLGGLAGGLMVAAALLARGRGAEERSPALRLLPWAAPLLLSLGMGALFLDLAYKAHVLRFYGTLRASSPMSWGAWILLLVYPAALLQGAEGLAAADLARLAASRVPLAAPLARLLGRISAWARARADLVRGAAIALGAALALYTGVLLGTLGTARPAWASAALAPLFLASGLSAGAALLLLAPVSSEERGALRRLDLGAIAAEGALLFLYVVGLASAGGAGHGAATLLLRGAFALPFLGLVVGAGLLLPAALEAAEERLPRGLARLAPALVLAGGLALRFVIVAAGQA